jgi:hypothetical protein
MDGIGALTCAAGLLGLVFGIIQINHLGLLHPRVLQSVAVGIGALLDFVWWEQIAGRTSHQRRPFTATLFPANRAKGESDLSDSAAHAANVCRRGVFAPGGGTDRQNRWRPWNGGAKQCPYGRYARGLITSAWNRAGYQARRLPPRRKPCADPSRRGQRGADKPSLRPCAPNLSMPTGMHSRRAQDRCSTAPPLFVSFVRCSFGSG